MFNINTKMVMFNIKLVLLTTLQIHLCCGDQSLGNCEIHLKDLLKPGSTEIYMKPVSIEGAFQVAWLIYIYTHTHTHTHKHTPITYTDINKLCVFYVCI